jgi:hypothetical protein
MVTGRSGQAACASETAASAQAPRNARRARDNIERLITTFFPSGMSGDSRHLQHGEHIVRRTTPMFT